MTQAVTEFQSLLGNLADQLQARIKRLLSSVAGLEQSELLTFITEAAPELLEPFLVAAADLTATWYDDQDPTSDFIAQPADLPASEALAAIARWAVLQADPVAAWSGAASNSVFETSRKTVIDNAKAEGVKWARYAREDACGFCKILAIRGFAYSSEKAAEAVAHADSAGHANCNCTAYPNRGPDALTPDSLIQYEVLVKDWDKQYRASRTAVGGNPGSIANAMDYLPGGRRYKGDDAAPHAPRARKAAPKSDAPAAQPEQPPVPENTETDAQVAKRLLPGLEESLARLRAQGFAEDSSQIQYHLTTIARLRRQLQPR